MTDGMDLMLELQGKISSLDRALHAYGERGRAYAQAEHDYKVALAEQITVERANGLPVTIIGDVCRGNRKIAKLRLERDISRAVYDSAREAINTYKLQIKVLENQIDREYRG